MSSSWCDCLLFGRTLFKIFTNLFVQFLTLQCLFWLICVHKFFQKPAKYCIFALFLVDRSWQNKYLNFLQRIVQTFAVKILLINWEKKVSSLQSHTKNWIYSKFATASLEFNNFFSEVVFCFQNCSDLLWEKNVLVIEKNFWNSRLKNVNLKIFWDH